jgi:hypothetical protein
MLEKVQHLGDSITGEQHKKIQATLGDELFGLLEHAFDSESDDEARERVAAFIEGAKKHRLRVLRMRSIFSGEQKSLLLDLWEASTEGDVVE